jgi:hypothetical protein
VVNTEWWRAEEKQLEREGAEQEVEFDRRAVELLWALGAGKIDNARFRELAEELDVDRVRVERAQ